MGVTQVIDMEEYKLTVKQRRLIQGVVQGKTQTQAAIDAGYSKRSAAVIASKTLRKVNVYEYYVIALSVNGITMSDIVKPIADGLNAEKQLKYGHKTADHHTRLKAATIALRTLGLL